MTDDAPVGLKHLRPHVDYTPAHVTLRNWWHARPLRVVSLTVHHPVTFASLCLIGWLAWVAPLVLAGIVLALMAGLGALLHRHPEIHTNHLEPRYRGFGRAVRYRFRWITALEDCHIVEKARPSPTLIRVHWSPYLDRLLVRMVGAMSVETFFPNADAMKDFATALGVREVRAQISAARQRAAGMASSVDT